MKTKNSASLFFPNQIFDQSKLLEDGSVVYLIEDPLFFSQYAFHKQKLILHRASMKAFQARLKKRNIETKYVDYFEIKDTEEIVRVLTKDKVTHVQIHEPEDDWLKSKLISALDKSGITHFTIPSELFLTDINQGNAFFDKKDSYFFTSFYVFQRTEKKILLTPQKKPEGGKWTFDTENRKKLPKGHLPPPEYQCASSPHINEAMSYVEKYFRNNPGVSAGFNYPITREDAEKSFKNFLEYRLHSFGAYEDAISRTQRLVYHSKLTPALNIGLISPAYVISKTLEAGEAFSIPLNSLEGFIRQVLGWREYMRMVYARVGRKQRAKNFWNYSRKIPKGFWNADTGIEPVDIVITSVLDTAYCHHIERLMILGNFMLLCEFSPDEVYEWFMALFIDSYDWVMVPNVYGMSQYADGGLITTKPYISSSNYILKMSDHKKGPWCEIWDGLYWRFIDINREFFLSNPRMSIMPRQYEKIDLNRRKNLRKTAENFLSSF